MHPTKSISYRLFLEAEKPQRVAGRGRGDCLRPFAPAGSDRGEDVRQVFWLIAPALWLRREVARQEIRGVGLDHEPVGRDEPHEVAQVVTAALVADPPRDADRKVEGEVVAQFAFVAREAMGDPGR